jgi:SOS response regulatory protein OraA/RecX
MAKAARLDGEAAYETAVRMLARKSRSCAEVRAALAEKGATDADIESVIGRLKAHRHLDDAELASDEAYTLLESKGLSPDAAVYKLSMRGLDSGLARRSVESVREGRSEWVLCERALERRLKGRPLPERNAGREGRALARLGYEEEVVARVIERAMRGSSR